jgi:predicted RNase H-like HicB family nuclease
VDTPASWKRFLQRFRSGETLDEAKANLREVLQFVLECQRELAEKNLSLEGVGGKIQNRGTGTSD